MTTAIRNLADINAFLARHTDYEKQIGGRTRKTFDLERVTEVLNALARPDLSYTCAHVAGTKGKGSTSAFLASMLQSQGLRTGLYTSPHLERLTQRIAINGQEISEAAFVQAFQPVVAAVESRPGKAPDITFFELLTLCALVAFRQAGVQAAVLEVGLGGRLDATNVVSPAVCVITEIGLDHMQQLGNTVAEIAAEKAGIIKPGVPVVCGAQDPEAQRVINRTARDMEAPLLMYGRDYSIRGIQRSGCSLEFTADVKGQRYEKVRLPHPGRYMADNAAHALCALEVLATDSDLLPEGTLQRERALDALARTELPGKFEVFEGEPIVVIDSSHNELSLKAAVATARNIARGPVVLVTGIAADKDLEACLKHLAAGADAAVFTRYYSPRESDPTALLSLYQKFGGKRGAAEEHPEAALEEAIDLAGPQGLVLVTGSTYLAGALRAAACDYARREA